MSVETVKHVISEGKIRDVLTGLLETEFWPWLSGVRSKLVCSVILLHFCHFLSALEILTMQSDALICSKTYNLYMAVTWFFKFDFSGTWNWGPPNAPAISVLDCVGIQNICLWTGRLHYLNFCWSLFRWSAWHLQWVVYL